MLNIRSRDGYSVHFEYEPGEKLTYNCQYSCLKTNLSKETVLKRTNDKTQFWNFPLVL